jgi:23S rRNA (uracil1939-C5)-methyltransferase
MTQQVRIQRLGHRGDGVAETPDGELFIFGALPGELVEAERTGRDRAQLRAVLEPGPDRVEAFDPDAPMCGGCGLRHMAVPAQLRWKRELVIENLRGAGITAEVEPCVDAHGEGRRRATFHARVGADRVLRVGFTEPRAHAVVDLAEHDCPVMSPALKTAVEPVRVLAAILTELGKPVDALVTATVSGLDIDLRGPGRLPENLRLALTRKAGQLGLARLSLHGDTIIEFKAPVVRFGNVEVAIPPGGFLQATSAGEEAMVRRVMEGLGSAGRTADLFAGSGTFTLRMAALAQVLAVESSRPSLEALDRAARHATGLKKVMVEPRDLVRRPMQAADLKGLDAVVFDPPRAGAEGQARMLAGSAVPRVVAVSCNPGTLARDLQILVGGGYRVDSVLPIDQFRHSAHVEAVVLLSR